jgi:SulP family sulfate permease
VQSSRMTSVIPGWLTGYHRAWLGPDVIAGLIIWSVVVPQAVAYAQIAGLPPEAGLVAAPGAMIAYAILGTSRRLVVSATTATAAVSAAAVGPLADGDVGRFAALSATLALLTAAVFVAAGVLRLGGVTDLISKPVMTGFLFGLGLVVALGQLPGLLGVPSSDGNFFPRLWDLLQALDGVHWWTAGVGAVSVVALLALARLAPQLPATLVVLVGGIVMSALLDLSGKGVDVVGKLPRAVPELAWPSFGGSDVVALLPAAFGVMILSAEAIGVARGIATAHGRTIKPNTELIAMGGSNLLAGLSQGFVQSGGASQTAAAERAGGKTQLASIIAGGLILLTGAFLSPVFRDLPQPTLAAVVIVATVGFFRVDELRRFAYIRRSELVFALTALVGVLLVGVLPGLLVAAGLVLVVMIQRLSRPQVNVLARHPELAVWGSAERHPTWQTTPGAVVVRVDGALLYANALTVKEQLLALARDADPRPAVLVLDMAASYDVDVETLDALGELAAELEPDGVVLSLASVRVPVRDLLERGGVAAKVRIEPTVDAAVAGADP